MKSLTPELFEQLTSLAYVGGPYGSMDMAREIVCRLLHAVGHPDMDTGRVATNLKSWLNQGLSFDSWIGYNPTQEFAVSLLLPDLMAAYKAREAAIAHLAEAEAAALKSLEVSEGEQS